MRCILLLVMLVLGLVHAQEEQMQEQESEPEVLAEILGVNLGQVEDTEEVNEECTEDAIEKCLVNMMGLAPPTPGNEEKFCKQLDDTAECLQGKVDLCLDEEEKRDVQPDVDDMKAKFEVFCKVGDDGNTGIQCMQQTDRLKQLAERCIATATTSIVQMEHSPDIKTEQLQCMAFNMIIDCLSEEFKNLCGEGVSEMLVEIIKHSIPGNLREQCENEDQQQEEVQELEEQFVYNLLK